MAENEQEKTEAPSQRRRDDAAAEGRVARSTELSAAALLLASALGFSAAGPALATAMRDVLGLGLGFGAAGQLTATGSVELIRQLGWRAMGGAAGFLAVLALTALTVGAAQARGTFTWQPLTPKFSRLNPAQNAKRVVGTQGWIELGKSLVKLAVVGWAVRGVMEAAWPDIVALGQQPPRALLEVARTYGIKLLVHAGTAYLALAAADYGWQFWQHEQSLRMTKEEVKQESKQQDGDPMVKQRMRALARQRARRQMMKDVPKADVVVVNPVHIAVALRYGPSDRSRAICHCRGPSQSRRAHQRNCLCLGCPRRRKHPARACPCGERTTWERHPRRALCGGGGGARLCPATPRRTARRDASRR